MKENKYLLITILIWCSFLSGAVGQDLCFKQIIIPAKFDTSYKKVVIADAYTELICKPAEFITESEEKTIIESYTTDAYRYIKGEKVLCKIDVPAVKQTVYTKKMVSPAYTVTKYHPAQTQTIMKVKLKTPSDVVDVPIDCKTGEILRGYGN